MPLLYYCVFISILLSHSEATSYGLFCTANMHSLLDVAKIADSLVFVLDATEGWDSYGDYCLSCLFAQGLPSHGGYKLLELLHSSSDWAKLLLQ